MKKEMKELKQLFKIPRLRHIKMNQVRYDELLRLKSQEGMLSDMHYNNRGSTEGGLTTDLNNINIETMSAPTNQ